MVFHCALLFFYRCYWFFLFLWHMKNSPFFSILLLHFYTIHCFSFSFFSSRPHFNDTHDYSYAPTSQSTNRFSRFMRRISWVYTHFLFYWGGVNLLGYLHPEQSMIFTLCKDELFLAGGFTTQQFWNSFLNRIPYVL